jgi:hypothetical protein
VLLRRDGARSGDSRQRDHTGGPRHLGGAGIIATSIPGERAWGLNLLSLAARLIRPADRVAATGQITALTAFGPAGQRPLRITPDLPGVPRGACHLEMTIPRSANSSKARRSQERQPRDAADGGHRPKLHRSSVGAEGGAMSLAVPAGPSCSAQFLKRSGVQRTRLWHRLSAGRDWANGPLCRRLDLRT